VKVCRGDCDDTNPDVFIGAVEVCDGADNDCDPTTDDNGDLDGDLVTRCAGDCNDLDPSVFPGAAEVCDQRDNDCDGQIESDPLCYGCSRNGAFFMCTTAVSYPVARAACAASGLHLVDIANFNKNTAVANVSAPYGAAWIGLTDEAVEGVWEWEGGTPFGFSNWWPGEPNNSGGSENCIGINFGSLSYWNDWTCNTTLPFVCEQ
jgi:hypothetical protein